MARPRKPTRILELTGSFKKDPKRKKTRAREPQPEAGLGKPPKTFDESERARWKELIAICAQGVLTKQDRPAAESLCQLWAKSRRNAISVSERSLLHGLFGKFGLSPADRSKIQVPESDDHEDPLKKFTRSA